MKKLVTFYPILLAAYPILFLYSFNHDQTGWWPAIPVLLISMVVALVLRLLFARFTRDEHRAALAASSILLFILLYGHIQSVLHKPLLYIEFVVNVPGLGPVSFFGMVAHLLALGFFFWLGWLIRRKLWNKADLSGFSSGTAKISAILVLLPILVLMTDHLSGQGSEDPATGVLPPWSEVKHNRIPSNSVPGPDRPDIYYIMLDGYGRADALKKYYDHDNEPFYRELERRGFQIPRKSSGNFWQTYLSLASTLNMDLVDGLSKTEGTKSDSRSRPYAMIRRNRVARFLREIGYEYVHFNSTWGATQSNGYADRSVSCRGVSLFEDEFLRTLAESSILRLFSSPVGADLAHCHLFNWENLKLIGKEPGKPRFIFVHFTSPHHPYLFDRHGNILRQATISNQFEFQKHLWKDKKSYIEQLLFLNHQVIEVADAILKSDRPAAILVASDHGPTLYGVPGHIKDKVRLSTFIALKVPDGSRNVLPNDVSLVNVYRLLFNHLFGAGFELKPNRTFKSDYGRPYRFHEVGTRDYEF